MIRRFIIFLIRIRLRVKVGQKFRFANQKNSNKYYFTETELVKIPDTSGYISRRDKSLVSLNFLLSDECEVIKGDI